ncbi:alpha/beta hydrolase [Colletotrichum tofieldiae]|uniref:Carboxylic ester hydrolase n=1 Tax=Colletotrichum tofieldiae TaxID=708197 RepID=A0A166NW30_9PEZI|nr:alpha/beta hydrolase (carboxylesterase) [Colletotrichum tofieldiae]GKT53789.1 alpha/beta hydrolase [Colletotrichum tofieldiae]GKT73529.1 alpha/beta hydrolase [Colletotrichum tofieldiae]
MPARALALVALLAAAVSCAPSTQDLRTDITIIRDNDLLDSKSPAANTSALFLRSRVPFSEAKAACHKLGEELWAPESNSTQRVLSILDYQEPDIDLSAIWVAPKDGDSPVTMNLRSEVASADASATNPVLCMHTAPFSNGVSQDSTERWQVVVHSNREDVLGFRDRNSFRFQGMRFATKTERFAYPRMYRGSGGNATALEFGSPCYQGFGSEDCHYLNVYTPHLPRNRRIDDGLRPVMFWIHGGALTGGFGSDPLFDGGNLASRGDVVVVTINYRLGTLGYLALDDGETNGNFGLADQILALDWVREHIRDFGGDPNKITIFGQSAGAASVRAMMASPKASGKFAAAIPMSNLGGISYGASYSKYFSIEDQLELVGDAILGTTNCTNATSQVECLRKVPVGSLGPGARYLVNDGVYLTTDELQLKGAPLNVHVLTGIMSEDGLPFLIFPRNGTVINDTQWLTSQGLPAPPPRLFAPIETKNTTRAAFGVGAQLATDAMFRCVDQATVFAGLDSGVLGSKVYYYEFERTYQTPEWPRLDICEAPKSKAHPAGDPESPIDNLRCHSGELLPLFGNIVRQGNPLRDEYDLPWEQYLVDTFTSFARTYNPNPGKEFLKARGFESTLRAQEKSGPWEPSVRGQMKMRKIDWPVERDMMRDFKDIEQCKWLKLPLDYYI